MTTFRIYERASTEHEVVKVGFSFPAFFLDWIWALFVKMPLNAFWILLGSLFFFFIFAAFVSGLFLMHQFQTIAGFYGFAIFLSCLPFKVVIGFTANGMLCRSLEQRGYRLIATVTAETGEQALKPYMNNNDAS